MKKAAMTFLVSAFFAGTVFSQVNICGTVTDENGKPLTNTIVRLGYTTHDNGYWARAPYLVKTDKNGHYQLGTGTCNNTDVTEILLNKGPQGIIYPHPMYKAGKVVFSLPAGDAVVRISMYDVSGRFVRDVMAKTLSKGSYSMSIDTRGISTQFYLLRVTINGVATVMKVQPAMHMQGGEFVRSAAAYQTRLEKLAAIVDTIHATEPAYTIGVTPVTALTGTCNFTLKKNTAWNGDVAAFWGDTSTYPKKGTTPMYVMLNRTNGTFPDSKVSWNSGMLGNGQTGTAFSQNNKKVLQGERLYFYVAPGDSNRRYFDFLEVNSGGTNWAGNTTRVDGWRIPITFRLKTTNGVDTVMGDSYELFFQSRKSKYDEYINEVPVEFTWEATHDFANIYAPHKMDPFPFRAGKPYGDYFKRYQDSAVAHYVKDPAWNNDPGPLKPVTQADDIFACTGGGIGSDPTWSAAISRHVAMMPQGANYINWDIKDTASYYQGTPCNYFSYWCHRRSIDNLCYGFPYDDNGSHEAYINLGNIQWIAVAIGW
jgi:hypothetical protein